MYPSKGSNSYGQQSYPGQQSYAQMPGTGFSQGQSGAMGTNQEADVSGFRSYPSQGAQYSGPYASLYGAAALSAAQQVGGVGGKGTVPSGVQERMSYPSTLPPESSKFSSGALGSNLGMNSEDYVSASNRGYAQKGDQFSAVKGSEYASTERRQYGDQTAYLGRELQSDSSRRYADTATLNQQHQADMHEHMIQASMLRQQQVLKAQALQSGSDIRQSDYIAARAAQEFSSFGGRADVDPRSLSILGSAPYAGQDAASILGGAPRRNVDNLYAQGSSSAAYGVGLPPGRDYVAGKGLQGASLESEYQGTALLRGHHNLGASMADERKDDRVSYHRELELRDEERRRELLREREKEREREEQRERQRERDRERDRLERREKERERERERERDRDRKRELDSRRQRTPPRATRDRRGSSLLKDERTPRRASPRRLSPQRRVSPRRDAVHRRPSPVKEKKREYICKVYPFCLVDPERDYLSLNKRYPRLSISSDCSKVVLHWPKGSLHLSLHTPVSFEHEVVEIDNKGEKGSNSLDDLSKSTHGTTVWNAKVILLSGISADALDEMSSYKSSDEKILHFNNLLRFAILRKDRSFTAIGGPWDPTIDGGDPSIEDSSLIQTACRYVREITRLDLQKCQNWNRFLEIHYDRAGDDGLFSHKEITVLFVPDLSECLPSLDSWRSQWLAHKKDVADRERLLAAKQEKKSAEKKDSVKEKAKVKEDVKVSKSGTDVPVLGKETDTEKTEGSNTMKKSNKNGVEQKGKEAGLDKKQAGAAVDPSVNVKEEVKEEGKLDSKKAADGAAVDPSVNVEKPGKKKVVKKKVVKGKVASKTAVAQKVEISLDSPTTKEKPVAEMENKDEEKIAKKEPVETASSQGKVVKTTGKKKIIRRVIKRKVSGTEVKAVNAIKEETAKKNDNAAVLVQKAKDGEEIKEEIGTKNAGIVGISTEKTADEPKRVIKRKVSGAEVKAVNAIKEETTKKSDNAAVLVQKAKGGEEIKEEIGAKNAGVVGISTEKTADEPKRVAAEKESRDEKKLKDVASDDQNSKSEKSGSKSSAEAKPESKPKSLKELKEKVKAEEPPEHPGLFLQTKRSKESRIRTMSLSLDGLLDYNDKDVEESTFELSVFAESLNEMLQYQMGCRLLSFLEKLRRKFIISKNQRKRQRDDKSEKDSEKESSAKRPKGTVDSAVENESKKTGAKDASKQNPDEAMGEDGSAVGEVGSKTENKSIDGTDNDTDNNEDEDIEEEEDPEEIIEDDEEMEEVSPSNNGVQEHDGNVAKSAADSKKQTIEENDEKGTDGTSNKKPEKEDDKPSETVKTDSGKEVVVHKEVLQAFRYFDHNRVGYVKVEDLRCLIHNLGKFLSHRDVKEMVQSALFESNSARDNRIFYKKLVRLTDI